MPIITVDKDCCNSCSMPLVFLSAILLFSYAKTKPEMYKLFSFLKVKSNNKRMRMMMMLKLIMEKRKK